MAQLRITGVSNNQLELQAPDGARHYLEITDDLLKALKSREVSLPKTLTPRDIQQQIRLGASIEEVVANTGADEELVSRFAKPIIAELNHIVALARNIRLSLAGDRFAEPALVEFGSVMDERLQNNGARRIEWSAKKSVEGDWLVSVDFDTANGAGIATWSFDPKQLFLAPENETALQLSNGVPVTTTKTVPLQAEPVIEEPIEEPVTGAFLTVVPEVTVTETIQVIDEDLFEEVTTSTTLHVVPDSSAEPEIEIVEEVIEEVPEELEEQIEEPVQSESDPTPKPQSNSRWAEVLFGSKEEDEEEF